MKVQRHEPPTAAPLSLMDLVRGVGGLLSPARFRARLECQVKAYFSVKHAFFLTSGKAALTTILRGLQTGSRRRKVIIPAYTCFSVPAAVVRAGLEVVLCDVDPHTLDFNFTELRARVDHDTLAVVAPHLLGQPADIDRVTAIGRSVGAYIIEDAAQAMGGKPYERWLGTQGDVGFFSFGRGKNVSAGSGGVIVTNSDHIADAVMKAWTPLPVGSLVSSVKNLLIVATTTLLLNPRCYWLPAGLPWLRLGETQYYTDFPICRMDGGRAGLLWSWRKRLEESNAYREKTALAIERRLSLLPGPHEPARRKEATYLRFPVLMSGVMHKLQLCHFSKQQGLGVSPLYPYPINEIQELKAAFTHCHYPGAERLAECLVTLPVHQFVRPSDVERIIEASERLMNNASDIPSPVQEAVPVS